MMNEEKLTSPPPATKAPVAALDMGVAGVATFVVTVVEDDTVVASVEGTEGVAMSVRGGLTVLTVIVEVAVALSILETEGVAEFKLTMVVAAGTELAVTVALLDPVVT
jgi:hypothetical protein